MKMYRRHWHMRSSSASHEDYRLVCIVIDRVTDPEMNGYGEPPTGVWRRYSEFELLRSYLEVMYPAIVVPPVPEKRVSVLFCVV